MARSFNGSSDQILSTNAFNQPAAGTLSCWIYATGTPNTYNAIVTQDSVNSLFQILVKSTGKFAWYVKASGTISIDPGTTSVVTNTWTHVALAYDSVNGLVTYINGVSDGTAAANGAMVTSASKMCIGFDQGNAGFNFQGRLADAAEWNTNLTALEVTSLVKGARPYQIRIGSLIGWWPLDGLYSPEPDLSGNINNGVLTGTSLAFGPPYRPFTPRWPMGAILASASSTTVYRRTLSDLGTRTGSRQVHA